MIRAPEKALELRLPLIAPRRKPDSQLPGKAALEPLLRGELPVILGVASGVDWGSGPGIDLSHGYS